MLFNCKCTHPYAQTSKQYTNQHNSSCLTSSCAEKSADRLNPEMSELSTSNFLSEKIGIYIC